MTSKDQQSHPLLSGAAVFRTDRLVVRRWRAADEPLVLALYGDRRVVRWVDDGQALSASEAAQWMEVTCNNYRKRGYGMFAVEDRHRAPPIGFGGLVHPGDQVDAEVKYALSPDVWGRGLATEFVQGLLGYGHRVHHLSRVIASVAAENVASQRVLLKSGFRPTGPRTETDGSRTEMFAICL